MDTTLYKDSRDNDSVVIICEWKNVQHSQLQWWTQFMAYIQIIIGLFLCIRIQKYKIKNHNNNGPQHIRIAKLGATALIKNQTIIVAFDLN